MPFVLLIPTGFFILIPAFLPMFVLMLSGFDSSGAHGLRYSLIAVVAFIISMNFYFFLGRFVGDIFLDKKELKIGRRIWNFSWRFFILILFNIGLNFLLLYLLYLILKPFGL